MHQRVKNLTNSPYDLPLKGGGSVRLPAFDAVEGDFDPEYVELLKSSAAVELVSGDVSPMLPGMELPPAIGTPVGEQLPGLPPMPLDTTGDGVPEMPPVLPGLEPRPFEAENYIKTEEDRKALEAETLPGLPGVTN